MNEYPKLMWAPDGVEVTVGSASVEAERAAQGFSTVAPGTPVAASELPPVAEPEPEPEPEFDNEPTFGPADDDTHAKRGDKKK